VASAKKYEECAKVFGIGKLLQVVYQSFCENSKAIA